MDTLPEGHRAFQTEASANGRGQSCSRPSLSRRKSAPEHTANGGFSDSGGVDERLDANYLVIPNTSSERREYIPIGWLSPSVVANQKLRILPDATLGEFALLTSAMHMAWMRQIGGRLESRYSYGVGVNYNTFPTPTR